MGVTLERVQFKFASIIGELCSEPDILSQFAVWVDLRLAEYKLKGAITLECDGDAPDPAWMKGILSALLKRKSKENAEAVSSCCLYKGHCASINEAKEGNKLVACDDNHISSHPAHSRFSTSSDGNHLSSGEKHKQNLQGVIKTEHPADDCVLLSEHYSSALADSTVPSKLVPEEQDSCNSTVNSTNDSKCHTEDEDTPTNQSLMSIIGRTLPETEFASETLNQDVHDGLKKIAQKPPQNQNVQLNQTPPQNFPLMNTPILFQVPISAVNMMNNQCGFINTVACNSGQAGMTIPVSQMPCLPSSIHPNMSSLHVPMPAGTIPLSPKIPISNTASTSFSGGQTKCVQNQNISVAQKNEVVAVGKKRKSTASITSSSPAQVAYESQSKKQVLSTKCISNVSISEGPVSEAAIRQTPNTVTSTPSTQSTMSSPTSNQVPKSKSEVSPSSSSSSDSPRQGRKVGYKYPMKKRQFITKYRPILPADSGLKISSTCSLNSEAADKSPTK